jgi:hypothetical protein
MTAILISFSTDPQGTLSHEEVLANQKDFLAKEFLPELVKLELDFHFFRNYIRETEEDSEYIDLRIVVKCFWDGEKRKILDLLTARSGVTIEKYPDCEVPNCYNVVAAKGVEKLKAPLFNRHGEEIHAIHTYCRQHLKPQDLAILRTIETLEETPGERYWTKILVWSQRGCWYAQRVQNDQDEDYETGYHDYVYGRPWQVKKTREAAIQAARDCD